MTERHDIVIVGAGHNGLTAGCYLAKAGLDVCLIEKNDSVGGGVLSGEYIAPGFVTDHCSTIHVLAQLSPTIKDDDLGLKKDYGFEYIYPKVQMCIHFLDGTTLSIYNTLEETCQEIAKYSEKDAQAYRKFQEWAAAGVGMIVQGFYAPPPSFGTFAGMMDSGPEMRELLRATMMSCEDVIDEWFENDKVKIALTRWISEIMVDPSTKGTGIMVFVMLGTAHMGQGAGMPKGGSGSLSKAEEAYLKDHGATIHLNSEAVRYIVEDGKCTGVITKDGKEIYADQAVISGLHLKQVFPHMIPEGSVPEDFQKKVDRLKSSDFSCFQQSVAIHEPPKWIADSPQLNEAFIVEFAPNTLDEYKQYFFNIKRGIPAHFPLISVSTIHDPSRAPEGKHIMYFYEYAPYDLRDGGSEKWREMKEDYAEEVMNFLRKYTTNMGPENIIGKWSCSPVELEEHDPAMVRGDFAQLGSFLEQNLGNRPIPGYNYTTPIDKLFICGPGCHPGSGVSCGGRAAAMAVLEALGKDIDDI